ncbi:MAG: response regulator transcription factor, partial [Clostridiales bacterium]|nr:response regulator transcription factor [Clostridiales bacterium]
GADEYVTKPFSAKVLLLKINALINRYRGLLVKNGMIVIDDLVIEPAKRRVTIGGTDVALPPKEYDLLMYLLDNKDIVLTRDQILDHVWGADYEGYDRAVDTHIKKLRAALGTMGSHIETVIKAGYKWKS